MIPKHNKTSCSKWLVHWHNRLSDKNFIWFPFHFLKPRRSEPITQWRIFLMTACFGCYGVLVYLTKEILFHQFSLSSIMQAAIFIPLGFFLWFQLVTSRFWNMRAQKIKSRYLPILALSLLSLTAAAQGAQMSQMERIQTTFNELRADKLEILDTFYAPDTHFEDPLGVHKGLASVKDYYRNLYQNVTFIEFEFTDTISDDNKHLVVWTMRLKAKGLNGGEMVSLQGNSVIKFNENNLVSYHRDYFDMGEFIYEHIPVLGWMVRQVKARMGSN